MKLRLRTLESKQTHRIEIPNSYNLHQLKQSIAHHLSLQSDGNLRLSLNRIHELSESDDSIQTLGLTSGDLLYYSFDSSAFSSVTVNTSNSQRNPNNPNPNTVDSTNPSFDQSVVASNVGELAGSMEEGCSQITNPSDKNRNFVNSRNPNDETRDLGKLVEETQEDMEVDDEESSIEKNHKFSVPSFLKKVFVKEVGDVANECDHKLLVIAVHAVLLESGFVAYDPISGSKFDGFHLNDEWPKSAFGLSLCYTLPEVASSEVVETVVLKFQALGKFLTVYGSVPRKGFEPYRISLDETRFTPALSFILKNGDDTDYLKSYPNKEVFEFWKIVKDGLSYPLLIDLCEKTGLVPPSCFTLLPTDLKLNIFETLSAVDLARVSCVSSELNFLASKNELWKSKYEEEFGNSSNPQRDCHWKAMFSSTWDIRKKRKRLCMPTYPSRAPFHIRPSLPRIGDPYWPSYPRRRDPNGPVIFGGDYDLTPYFVIPPPHGPRIFRRNCNLGGFGP